MCCVGQPSTRACPVVSERERTGRCSRVCGRIDRGADRRRRQSVNQARPSTHRSVCPVSVEIPCRGSCGPRPRRSSLGAQRPWEQRSVNSKGRASGQALHDVAVAARRSRSAAGGWSRVAGRERSPRGGSRIGSARRAGHSCGLTFGTVAGRARSFAKKAQGVAASRRPAVDSRRSVRLGWAQAPRSAMGTHHAHRELPRTSWSRGD